MSFPDNKQNINSMIAIFKKHTLNDQKKLLNHNIINNNTRNIFLLLKINHNDFNYFG